MFCDAASAVTDIGFADTSCGTMPCPGCPLQAGSLPTDLSARELDTVAAMIGIVCNVHRGESVYRSGDRFHSIYTVKCSLFKTVMMLADGREQVTGFHIVGEPLGLDGVFGGSYTCDAIALEDSTLCILPFQALESLCYEVQAMQRHVHKLMSGEIIRESGLMTMLGMMTAQERVTVFLVNLSKGLAVRGYSAMNFICE